MANIQEEKIKKIFKAHRIKVNEVIEKLFPQGKGSYYSAIRKEPLGLDFIESVQRVYGFNIEEELLLMEGVTMEHINDLWKEIRSLNKKLEETQSILEEIKKGR